MRLADELADAPPFLAEGEHGRGGAAIAHLVDQARERHVVARAEASVRQHAVLRHDEERDALHAGRSARNLREHEVHDVLGELVVAGRDEDLAAADRIGAVRVGRGRRGDIGERRAGLRLGERHGAEPGAAQELRQVAPLLVLGAKAVDDVGVRDGEERVGRRGDVRALEQRERGLRHGHRKLHAAELVVVRRRDEAGVDERFERFLDLGNHVHPAPVERGLVLVGLAVVRRELFLRDRERRVDHGVERLARVLGVARPLGQRLRFEHFVELKLEIPAVDDPGWHGVCGSQSMVVGRSGDAVARAPDDGAQGGRPRRARDRPAARPDGVIRPSRGARFRFALRRASPRGACR